MNYRITLDRMGGEYCVGAIPRETINYWSKRDKDDLKEHLFADSIPNIPSKHNLHPFHEQNNLVHTCGVEMSLHNTLTVSNDDTGGVVFECNLDEEWIKENAWIINDEQYLDDGTGRIHTVSVEKGCWEYGVFTGDEPFDYKKLQFFMYDIDGLYVIDYMKYEDVEIGYIDGHTEGMDFNVWFD